MNDRAPSHSLALGALSSAGELMTNHTAMPHDRCRSSGIFPRIALAAMLTTTPFRVASSAPESPQEQVFATERAFAKSMADRSLSAFSAHVADEAVFFTGAVPLRGKAEVVSGWTRFFETAAAPFSWEPDQVEVLQSGTLALSTGLVRDPGGKVIARFNSVWRLEAPGVWRVVFDKGSPPEPAIPAGHQEGEEAAVLAAMDRYMHAISTNDLKSMAAMQMPDGMTYRARAKQGAGMEIMGRPNSYWVDPSRADGRVVRERYWSPTVLVRGSIAVVWAPYEFWTDGKTSHCGVDVFDFVKIDDEWRVSNSMWTVEPDACDELRPADRKAIRPTD